jgi:hypothetical protein
VSCPHLGHYHRQWHPRACHGILKLIIRGQCNPLTALSRRGKRARGYAAPNLYVNPCTQVRHHAGRPVVMFVGASSALSSQAVPWEFKQLRGLCVADAIQVQLDLHGRTIYPIGMPLPVVPSSANCLGFFSLVTCHLVDGSEAAAMISHRGFAAEMASRAQRLPTMVVCHGSRKLPKHKAYPKKRLPSPP